MSTAPLRVNLTLDLTKFNAAMARTTAALQRIGPNLAAARERADRRRRRAYIDRPKPLCIDGHEYARRRRSR